MILRVVAQVVWAAGAIPTHGTQVMAQAVGLHPALVHTGRRTPSGAPLQRPRHHRGEPQCSRLRGPRLPRWLGGSNRHAFVLPVRARDQSARGLQSNDEGEACGVHGAAGSARIAEAELVLQETTAMRDHLLWWARAIVIASGSCGSLPAFRMATRVASARSGAARVEAIIAAAACLRAGAVLTAALVFAAAPGLYLHQGCWIWCWS